AGLAERSAAPQAWHPGTPRRYPQRPLSGRTARGGLPASWPTRDRGRLMHLLDTDTLTRAHAGSPGIAERVRQVGEQNVATTIISAIEILRGRHEFLLKASN